MASLSAEDRAFLEGHIGLGNSQKAEVAWLEEMGYDYEELDIRDVLETTISSSPRTWPASSSSGTGGRAQLAAWDRGNVHSPSKGLMESLTIGGWSSGAATPKRGAGAAGGTRRSQSLQQPPALPQSGRRRRIPGRCHGSFYIPPPQARRMGCSDCLSTSPRL